MQNKYLYGLICCALILVSYNNVCAQSVTAGLKAYYPFNGNFLDASGNGNNGVARNGTTFTIDKWGNANSAAFFDGINDWIYIAPSASITMSSAMTMAFRVKPAQSVVSMLATKADTTGSGGVQNVQFQVGFNLPVSSGYPKGFFYNTMHDGSCATATQGNISTTGVPVDTGTWYCVIFIFNNGVKKTYVDGVLMSSQTVTGTSFNTRIDSCTNGPLKLGMWWTGDPGYYKGVMDEVRLYNRELSVTEMDSLCYYTDTSVYIAPPLADTVMCVLDTLQVNYGTVLSFNGGNTFTAQLSNASGSFASPVNIGSVTATTTGTITCVIPAGMPTGSGYKIRVVSTSPVKISRDIPVTFDIYNTFPANFSATSNSPICNGDTLKLFGNSTSIGVSYSWSGPLGYSSSLKDATILNAGTNRSGDYILTGSLNGCIAKDTVSVLVRSLPATPVAGSNSPVCPSGTLNLTANNVTGATYSWTGPASFSSSVQNPSIVNITTANAGVYAVRTILNGCASLPATTTVAVALTTPTPAASCNSPVCTGGTLNLFAAAAGVVSYNWTGPNGFTSTLQAPVITNISSAHAGVYVVTAMLNGCASLPDSVTVVVNQGPQVNIYPSPNDSICTGKPVTLVALASNGGNLPQYKWLLNNFVIPGATAASYTSQSVSDGDIFRCILTNTSSCGMPVSDTSIPIPITVLPYLAPSVTITANPATPVGPWQLVTFTAVPTNCGANPLFQWKRNGQDVVGATSFTWGTYQLSDNDTISVVVKSSYLCPQPDNATSNKVIVSVLTSVEKGGLLQHVKIYPNPAGEELILEGIRTGDDIILTDVTGRIVYKGTASSERLSINLGSVAAGSYIVIIADKEGNKERHKIMKQ